MAYRRMGDTGRHVSALELAGQTTFDGHPQRLRHMGDGRRRLAGQRIMTGRPTSRRNRYPSSTEARNDTCTSSSAAPTISMSSRRLGPRPISAASRR